jgi:ketosteroid isomerase-like protein
MTDNLLNHYPDGGSNEPPGLQRGHNMANPAHFSIVPDKHPAHLRKALLSLAGSVPLLLTLVAPASAQVADYSRAVARVVERYHSALASGDSAAALALLAEDAVIIESGGLESRQEYRSHHLPADIAFARAVKTTRSPVRVTVRRDVAWTNALSTARGTYRGKTVNSTGAESMVLTRGVGGWTIRAIHWSSHDR